MAIEPEIEETVERALLRDLYCYLLVGGAGRPKDTASVDGCVPVISRCNNDSFPRLPAGAKGIDNKLLQGRAIMGPDLGSQTEIHHIGASQAGRRLIDKLEGLHKIDETSKVTTLSVKHTYGDDVGFRCHPD